MISTKTKVIFLNTGLDIGEIFWAIPIMPYWTPASGVIKKQMKIVSKTIAEFDAYKDKIAQLPFVRESVIKQINNPLSRTMQFKDERKVTIGISKKDIMNDLKKKSAFYNCFALYLRIRHENVYKDIHIKVFITGKMEIPGIVCDSMFDTVKDAIVSLLQTYCKTKLHLIDNKESDNILINSNFNCGFFINRQILYNLLSKKYNIETSYDPCTYPGIKCKYYFTDSLGFTEKQRGYILPEDSLLTISELHDYKKYTEVSMMIFRTGSCLIVGNCSENIIRFIFTFIKKILHDEYDQIIVPDQICVTKKKKQKIKRKNISFSNTYYSTNTKNCANIIPK